VGAVMREKFCGVFKHKKQMYIVRLANANGPNCIVWPPKPLYRGLTAEEFACEIEDALNDYSSLGRSIYPQEWKERSEQALAYFGEKSDGAFQRKKKDITIRQDKDQNAYVLVDGTSGAVIEEVGSVLEVAQAIYSRIGEPTTEAKVDGISPA
jgi:hypothetical protein